MTPRRTAPLPEPVRLRLVAFAREVGDVEAANRLRIGRLTVARAGAGFDVRPSVATAIVAGLPEEAPSRAA